MATGINIINQNHANIGVNPDMQMNKGEYKELSMILSDPIHHTLTTSTSFDTHEQLFWAGTHSVRIHFLFRMQLHILCFCYDNDKGLYRKIAEEDS